MKDSSIYVAPSAKRGVGYLSQYFYRLKEALFKYFKVLEADNRPCLMQGTALVLNSLRADVFLLSFVETIAFHKLAWFQQWLALASLRCMKIRRKKIIFIFHNPRPHKGETSISRRLTDAQLRLADTVIAHSQEAATVARLRLAVLNGNPGKVVYIAHPVTPFTGKAAPAVEPFDVLIWGDILPYKGILEFVREPALAGSGLRVRIIGRCADPAYARELESALPAGVSFENRRASFEELAALSASARYVLFPYLPGSISSSGVLMDTLALGGTPVGPAVGAFLDLAQEGLCLTYSSVDELFTILSSKQETDPVSRTAFLQNHSWEAFAKTISQLVSAEG